MEFFLLTNFDKSCPSVTRDKEMSMSHNYEVIMSLPSDAEYPVEPFE